MNRQYDPRAGLDSMRGRDNTSLKNYSAYDRWIDTPSAEIANEYKREVRPDEPELTLFRRVSIGDVISNPEPNHKFRWGRYVPFSACTLLSGDGGVGKSTFALGLAISCALGKPYLGHGTVRSKVLFFSAEDCGGVIRRRVARICAKEGIDPSELESNFIALDASEAALLWDEGGVTDNLRELSAFVERNDVDFLIIDNASDSFGGDRLSKSEVTQFVRALVGVVMELGGSVLLLAHVNRATARSKGSSGHDFADGAAWHNAVRSRLFMFSDGSGITLEHQKSNYGCKGDPVSMRMDADGLLSADLRVLKASPEATRAAYCDQLEKYLISQLTDGHKLNKTLLEARLADLNMTRKVMRDSLEQLLIDERVVLKAGTGNSKYLLPQNMLNPVSGDNGFGGVQ
jgi:AAA domain